MDALVEVARSYALFMNIAPTSGIFNETAFFFSQNLPTFYIHPPARSSADILASARAAQSAYYKSHKKARTGAGGSEHYGLSDVYAHALPRSTTNETGLVSGKIS